MTLDKFTIKAQEAVQQAVNTAQMNGQQVIEPVHILKGVLEKAKDVTTFIARGQRDPAPAEGTGRTTLSLS